MTNTKIDMAADLLPVDNRCPILSLKGRKGRMKIKNCGCYVMCFLHSAYFVAWKYFAYGENFQAALLYEE